MGFVIYYIKVFFTCKTHHFNILIIISEFLFLTWYEHVPPKWPQLLLDFSPLLVESVQGPSQMSLIFWSLEVYKSNHVSHCRSPTCQSMRECQEPYSAGATTQLVAGTPRLQPRVCLPISLFLSLFALGFVSMTLFSMLFNLCQLQTTKDIKETTIFFPFVYLRDGFYQISNHPRCY